MNLNSAVAARHVHLALTCWRLRTTHALMRPAIAAPSRIVGRSLAWRQEARFRSRPAQRRTQVSASELRFGQPLHETHPHLLQAGERESRQTVFASSLRYLTDSRLQSRRASARSSMPSAVQDSPNPCLRIVSPYSTQLTSNLAMAPSSTSSTRNQTSSISLGSTSQTL